MSTPAAVGERSPSTLSLCCQLTYHQGDWVQLLQGPQPRSRPVAELLCQESTATWIARIPNHGEIVLDRSQFYC